MFLFSDCEKGIDVCFVSRNFNQKGVKALFSRNKKLASELIEDIDAIARYTVDEESLNTIKGLFCRKWEEEKVISDKHTKEALRVAVSYFKNNWVKTADVRNWWQGANPCMPVTNNGLERANAILKGDSGTQADKLGFQELLDQVMFFSLFEKWLFSKFSAL